MAQKTPIPLTPPAPPVPASAPPGRLAKLRAEIESEKQSRGKSSAEREKTLGLMHVLEQQIRLTPNAEAHAQINASRQVLKSLDAADAELNGRIIFLATRLEQAQEERRLHLKKAARLAAEIVPHTKTVARLAECVNELFEISNGADGLLERPVLHDRINGVNGVLETLMNKQAEYAAARVALIELGE